jgi:hypothetical protein
MIDVQTHSAADIEQSRHRARVLADQGRYRDAVALGQRVNRENPDLLLERQLVNWRHRAFYETAECRARADWPPALRDPRPDLTDRIPELGARELTADWLGGAIQSHGSLIVRGLLPAARMSGYIEAIEQAFVARERNAGAEQSDYAPLEPVNGHNLAMDRAFVSHVTVLMVDAPHFLARWMDEIEDCGVLGAVSSYLGERPALSANKATLYRLPHNPGSQWHQDGAFLGEGVRTVNLWVACTECGVDAPGLDIIPWRLGAIVPTGTHGSQFKWSVGEAYAEQLAANRRIATPHFRPGDAILFDQLCLHRTASRPGMTRGRYAIETWMFAPSHYRDGVPLLI